MFSHGMFLGTFLLIWGVVVAAFLAEVYSFLNEMYNAKTMIFVAATAENWHENRCEHQL